MKIKMLTSQVGVNFARQPGEAHDVADAEAIRMIEAGYAVPVTDDGQKTEKADATKPAEKRKTKP